MKALLKRWWTAIIKALKDSPDGHSWDGGKLG